MKLRLLTLGLISLLIAPAHGQSEIGQTVLNYERIKPARERKHFVGSGLRTSGHGAGFSVFYSYLLDNHWLIGTSILGTSETQSKSGGSLDNSQYYADESKLQTTQFELNTTYFFKDKGYQKWGWLVKAGAGHAQNKLRAGWKRYDRDPGVFKIGGDKRLRESQEETREFGSTFARLAGYYQFYFGSGNRVGHVLQLGAGALVSDMEKKVSYVRRDGVEKSHKYEPLSALLEFNYSLTF